MKDKRGFTLIELILIMGILSIVLALIFPPIFSSFKYFDIQNERINSISDARAAMDYLTRQIRKSDKVEVNADTITMDSVIYKLENGSIYKGNTKVFNGIDDLNINKSGKKIDIEILTNDYKLSSSIYIR